MIAVDGGEAPPNINTTAAADMLWTSRPTRVVLALALAVFLWASPAATLAGETVNPLGERDNAVVFGLTVTQLGVAAAVGAGAGAAGALVSGNVIAGASLGFGTLAAIYVAHLAAEAVLVGGVYYWWPWEAKPEAPASRSMAIRGVEPDRTAMPVLRLSR